MEVTMTEVIAVRRFWWEGEPDRSLFVRIGKPEQTPGDRRDFYCPIQMSGFGSHEHVEPIFGVDAFQAIELAIRYIGWRIFAINAKSRGRLRWEFGDDGRIPDGWEEKSVARKHG